MGAVSDKTMTHYKGSMDSGISPTTRWGKKKVLKVLIAEIFLGYTLQ
jgi:hypothetical protein